MSQVMHEIHTHVSDLFFTIVSSSDTTSTSSIHQGSFDNESALALFKSVTFQHSTSILYGLVSDFQLAKIVTHI